MIEVCLFVAVSVGLGNAFAGEDLAQMLPRLKPLSPDEALKAFHVEKGFHVDLIAAEPDVTDPVAVAWDEDGRLYVCELWNYPGHPKPKEPLGRVRLLESTKGDGVYDKNTIFADNVLWPSGVIPWDGGVFVISSPDIWYFKDTTGSGKAGVRKKVFTGFRGKTYEPANNVVARLELRPEGVGFKAARPDAERKIEFLASTDNWFRPVNFANGPDGCLTVVSMYREVIEDDGAIPADILKHLDLYSGRERGRLYRVAPDGFKAGTFPLLSKASIAELVKTLEHPDAWWRETAQRLLYFRQDKTAVDPLKKLARDGPPLAKIHALWTLSGLGALDEQTLLAAMSDTDAHVREHAIRLAESTLPGTVLLRAKVIAASADPEPRVRLQTAFALSLVPGDVAVAALCEISKRDAQLFQATCAACHKPPQGERAGPNLATLEDRSPFTLLVAILDPNREVKPSFISYTLMTQDGLSLTGVVANETATSVTLRSSGGKEESVLRKNIKRLASSGLSPMPEGLEAAINPQQMADLLRFLAEMK